MSSKSKENASKKKVEGSKSAPGKRSVPFATGNRELLSDRPVTTSSQAKNLSLNRPLTSTVAPLSSRSGRTSQKSGEYQTSSERRLRLNSQNYTVNADGFKTFDLSGQGLTTLYGSLFSDVNIGEMDLSSNNIRSVSPKISKLRNLTKLDLSKNGILCLHPADYSGLPTDMELLVNLKDLCLSECNFACVPPVVWQLRNLCQLDLSRNKFHIISPDIGNLTSLRSLNLKHTSITSLPLEIAYCQELESILLWGNIFEELPETISDLPKLKILGVNYKSLSNVIDGYMETLLKRGQILSEHIPAAVFQMTVLESLNLEATKINTIPQINTIHLKELCLSRNYLKKLPDSFFKLKNLEVLNLSNNMFYDFPNEIGQIKSLINLSFNDNMFERIPSSIGLLENLVEMELSKNRIRHLPAEIGKLVRLKRLILEQNDIQSLPEEISNLNNLETLNLRHNVLRELPIQMYKMTSLTVAHGYEKLTRCGLWVDNNPLQQPPPEIWKTTNTQKIFEYLKRLKISNIKGVKPLKVIFLGQNQAGKTSLKNVLVNGMSELTDSHDASTRVLDMARMETSNGIQFTLFDLGCDQVYTMLWPLFLDCRSLIFIVYDHSRYTSKHFYSSIGRWWQLVCEYIPKAIVKIIGTHSDCVTADQSKETLNLVRTDLDNFIKSHQRKIQGELEEVSSVLRQGSDDEKKVEKKTENIVLGQKQLFARLKKLKFISKLPHILPEINVVSSGMSKDGIENVITELETISVDRELFPFLHEPSRPSWTHLHHTMMENSKDLYLFLEDLAQKGEEFSMSNDDLIYFLRRLHDTGEIFWYSDIDGLSGIIFHRPKVLVQFLADLFRHDISDWFVCTNKVFSCQSSMTDDEVNKSRDMLLCRGQISHFLLNCLWFYRNVERTTFDKLLEILPLLNICYRELQPQIPRERPTEHPLLVLPWFNTSDNYLLREKLWTNSPLFTDKEIRLNLVFPFGMPVGLFENLTVRLRKCFSVQVDWWNGVYGETDFTKTYLQKMKDAVGNVMTIRIFCRGSEVNQITEMLRLILRKSNAVMARIPGLYYYTELEEN